MRLLHSFILAACLLIVVITLNILQERYYQEQHEIAIAIEKEVENIKIPEQINKSVIFYNSTKKRNTGYKHWTGKYYPTTFALRINDTLLQPGINTPIDVTDNQFTIRIDYSFVNGYKKGGIIATYKLQKKHKVHNCNFISWTGDERFNVDGATYVSHKKDNFDSSVNDICCYL